MKIFDFSTATLQDHPHSQLVQAVLQAALHAVDPAEAVRRSLVRQDNLLTVGERTYPLDAGRRVWIVAAGKAAAPMAEAAALLLHDRLAGGVVITKDGCAAVSPDVDLLPLVIYEAGHPLPDERGVHATQHLAQVLTAATADDLVLAFISGGGSALLTQPAPGITLADIQALTTQLLGCGASINQINTLRKHMDSIKGGGMATLAAPAELLALVLSDVVGDPLDVIASGPTVPDPSTYADALGVLADYHLIEQTPPNVLDHLTRGAQSLLPETPKPGDPIFERTHTVLIGSNLLAAQAGLAEAQHAWLNTLLLTTCLQGEAEQAGRTLAAILREVARSGNPLPRPCCMAVGGETTVVLRGSGKGGRNQQAALAAVADLAGLPSVLLVTLATDGGDGPTDAAGAVVSGQTLARAADLGLTPQPYLRNNDAYNFFAPLGDLLRPGPTQTNVNDLAFLFAF